jgi:hypothetical protein
MKKVLLASIFTIAFLTGCSTESNENSSSTEQISQSARLDCDPVVIDINAGQHYLSGNVTISNDLQNLFVTYNANEDWNFKELHLFVGDYEDVPTRNGNPVPGRFPYKVSFNQLTTTYTFTIPLSEVETDANGCFTVAAHSSMRRIGVNGGNQTETGWAGYSEFPGNNWARYFNYCKCQQVAQ